MGDDRLSTTSRWYTALQSTSRRHELLLDRSEEVWSSLAGQWTDGKASSRSVDGGARPFVKTLPGESWPWGGGDSDLDPLVMDEILGRTLWVNEESRSLSWCGARTKSGSYARADSKGVQGRGEASACHPGWSKDSRWVRETREPGSDLIQSIVRAEVRAARLDHARGLES